ncbi:response regulator transcription factor [Massilibacterium senegalense]|uniref:response regulator transcription factor n=1 Tax=Massilibacterium senegalense TaxID=1632858 RepID=UPI000780C556|nr:response regulator transcription factor [Massilibacterium senegalense]
MIRIVIAEDQGMLLGALGMLLDLEEDISVVGKATNGEVALALIEKLQPDVVLLDIEMPLKSGLDVAEQVKQKNVKTKVMIVTTFARPGYFERAMKAGVSGYVLKDSPIETLTGMIRDVMKGKQAISPELAIDLFYQKSPLTNREKDLLLLIEQGKTSKEIAEALFLSEGTVRNYTSRILEKLYAHNRTEAVKIAKEKGYI